VQLMRTDGTAAGTILLRSGFTRITGFQVLNGVAYFAGTDPVNGTELWRSDGTVEGTALVADLTPGAAASQTLVPAVFRNRLLFTAAGNLWISDGTAAGTHVVKALPYVSGGAVHGNHFYFVSEEPASGRELWKTDGTAAGTTLVYDVDPGPNGSIDSAQLVARPDGVFFPASDRISGREPWITDGTSAGTRLLKNVAPDIRNGSYPEALANVGGRLVFQAATQIWTSDGTAEGTSVLTVPGLNVDEATASGGLYYFVNDELPALQLWRTDGTVPGTFPLFAMGDSRFFDGMTPLSGGLFFAGSDPAHGVEPWFTDGTVAGTRLLKDIDPGTSNGFVHTSSAHEVEAGTLAFLGEGEDGNEIWLTDGTPANTRRLMRLERHGWSILPGAFTKFGDAIYFLGVRQGEPLTLWKADAVTGDFVAVHQIPGQLYSTAIWKVGDAMLFTAGDELWRSDGTEAGTVMVRDGLPAPECINLQNFVVGDGLLYWYGHAGNVPELWRSDGTAAGTFRLGKLMEAGSCRPRHFHYSDGRLYFAGRDDLYGSEPWVTDGTLMGTRLLADVNPGPDSSGPDSFMRIGRTLYFAADLPSTGRELWAMETGCAGECRSRRRSIRH
jgi:ELWxxDGT repeat protein